MHSRSSIVLETPRSSPFSLVLPAVAAMLAVASSAVGTTGPFVSRGQRSRDSFGPDVVGVSSAVERAKEELAGLQVRLRAGVGLTRSPSPSLQRVERLRQRQLRNDFISLGAWDADDARGAALLLPESLEASRHELRLLRRRRLSCCGFGSSGVADDSMGVQTVAYGCSDCAEVTESRNALEDALVVPTSASGASWVDGSFTRSRLERPHSATSIARQRSSSRFAISNEDSGLLESLAIFDKAASRLHGRQRPTGVSSLPTRPHTSVSASDVASVRRDSREMHRGCSISSISSASSSGSATSICRDSAYRRGRGGEGGGYALAKGGGKLDGRGDTCKMRATDFGSVSALESELARLRAENSLLRHRSLGTSRSS
eukprot:TRINITY_DN27219_c0_g1_i2.p1 TRINITY_DN27219_c0_g1~~TRINITY_DN27219_c0_g1_i2.p1  ORF type:complete len:374 (-),score=57.81 TRINITY_DN27219_c0_g1_i2:90-1211(-)